VFVDYTSELANSKAFQTRANHTTQLYPVVYTANRTSPSQDYTPTTETKKKKKDNKHFSELSEFSELLSTRDVNGQ
jgi:hypothetical protein